MTKNPETSKEKDRVRVHNTRLHKRQANFAGNRPGDYPNPLDKTPKVRNQKSGLQKKKNLTVEPLSKKPLYTMEANESNTGTPAQGAGEVEFDRNGRLVEEPILPLTTSTATTNIGTGARRKTSEFQTASGGSGQTNLQYTTAPSKTYYNRDNFGMRGLNANIRVQGNQNEYELAYRPLTVESVRVMIGEAQEKSMQTMMQKFEQMLKNQFMEKSPAGDRENGNQRPKKTNNRGNHRNNNKRYEYNVYSAGKGALNNTTQDVQSRTQNNYFEVENSRNLPRSTQNEFYRYYESGGNDNARGYDQYQDIPLTGSSFRNTHTNRERRQSDEGREQQHEFGSANLSQESSSHNHGNPNGYHKVQLDKWNIRFDGSKIEEFWFKVECCKESSPYTWDQVFKHFQCLLSDRMQRWYWRFRENNRAADIQLLKNTMLDSFRTRENDLDIWGLMMKRKQRNGERFDDFWKEMEELSWRFKVSRSADEIIQVLRSNMLPEISLALTVYETRSLSKFLDKCREADKNIRYQSFSQSRFVKRVNELEIEPEDEPSLEALRFQFKKQEDKTSIKRENLTCANCDSREHLWRDCPIEKCRTFCYKCCHQGVTTPKCPNCNPRNSENFKHSD